MTEVIGFKNLSKAYEKRVWALREIDLSVMLGEFVVVVGPSGCGKSTVLKMVAGLDLPTSGEIVKPTNVSMVFQAGALFPWLTALENVEFGLKMRGEKEAATRSRALDLFKLVNLSGLEDKYPRELSGGQRQRVGIARAFAPTPEVLLMDEPFSALDTLTTDELHQDLLAIWRKTGTTILMVSHSLDEALLLGDRIVIMVEGRIAKIVTIDLPRPRRETKLEYLDQLEKLKREFKSLVT